MWKSSGVYKKKKNGSTKMPMVRIFTSRGHLPDKKQPCRVASTLVTGKKMKGWATHFFPLLSVLHHSESSSSHKNCATAESTFAGFFPLVSDVFAFSAETWCWCFVFARVTSTRRSVTPTAGTGSSEKPTRMCVILAISLPELISVCRLFHTKCH